MKDRVLFRDPKSPTGWRGTRVSEYHRRKHTLEPIEKLLKYLDETEKTI